MSKKLFLLDAMALIFRAYYALIRSPRVTSKGRNTNAQFGFTNALVDLINNQHPSHMAVCFDTNAPTERHTDFVAYKANRQETPEDILSSVDDIKAIIKGFNIPCMELDGYEADDVIGTLSLQAAAAGYEVYMVTPDKDYGQLVSDKIKIYKPPYQGGLAEILGPKEVCEKWNIKEVSQVIDILGLMGDSVDNIPGIPGVGEKTAAKLLAEYGTLENALANAEKIKGALGEKVRAGKDMAILSKKLATIITQVPVAFHEEDFRLKEWNREVLIDIFAKLEFKTVAKRILGEKIPGYRNGHRPRKACRRIFSEMRWRASPRRRFVAAKGAADSGTAARAGSPRIAKSRQPAAFLRRNSNNWKKPAPGWRRRSSGAKKTPKAGKELFPERKAELKPPPKQQAYMPPKMCGIRTMNIYRSLERPLLRNWSRP